MRRAFILMLLCSCGDGSSPLSSPQEPHFTPPEPGEFQLRDPDPCGEPTDWDLCDAGLPPMPDQIPQNTTDPELGFEPGEMHMREFMRGRSDGWCTSFCMDMGARQLHPQAFRTRLRSEWTMYAEVNLRTTMRCTDEENPLEHRDYAECVARGVEEQFGDEDICACIADSGPGGQNWVLVVPRERAFFIRGTIYQ